MSTRLRFRPGDPGWDDYIEFIGLSGLTEIRSIDASLNRYAEDFGDIVNVPDELEEHVEMLPVPGEDAYYQLAVNLDAGVSIEVPATWKLLGYDLADETRTSSLLNCGPWTGPLAPFTRRLNEYGLLSLADAREAQRLLPLEWGEGEHHAFADVWALYERLGPPPIP